MSKWADYLISAVRFNNKHTHIERVRAAIKKGRTYLTIVKHSNGKWNKGQPDYVIKVNRPEYIKDR